MTIAMTHNYMGTGIWRHRKIMPENHSKNHATLTMYDFRRKNFTSVFLYFFCPLVSRDPQSVHERTWPLWRSRRCNCSWWSREVSGKIRLKSVRIIIQILFKVKCRRKIRKFECIWNNFQIIKKKLILI